MRVVAVGECTQDRYVELGVVHAGGISLNFAINARREGADAVALVSCTGADVAAEAVRLRLAREGIDASRVHQRPGDTTSQVITLASGGERIFPPGGYDPGVLAGFRLDARDLALIAGADVVAVPYFRQIASLVEPILRPAPLGPTRVVDLLDGEDLGPDLAGLVPLLDVVDVLFVSGDEATVEQLLPHSARSRTLLVVTRGAAGSSALWRGARHDAPTEPVPIAERVDTTGCGDAFQAAFTVSWMRDRDIAAALHAGARRAAKVIRHLGATVDEAP